MKRKFLAGIALFVFLIGGVFAPAINISLVAFSPRVVYAQAEPEPEYGPQLPPPPGQPEVPVMLQPPEAAGTSSSAAAQQAIDESQELADQKAATDAELKCGVNPVCTAVKVITTVVMFPSFFLVAISGFILDWVLWSTISSDSYAEGNGLGSLAVAGWKLVRDITNILFIFALFTIAFSLILNTDTSKGTTVSSGFGMDPKRTIGRVIIMALLVNFSFFMGRVVIDFANVTGNFFFQKVDAPGGDQTIASQSNNMGLNKAGDFSTLYGANFFPGIKSVSLGILAHVNPQALVLQTQNESGSSVSFLSRSLWGSYDWDDYILILTLSFLVSCFNFFLCYMFLSIAFLLMGRTLGLIMGLIVSPLAFVSWAIPSLEKQPYIGFSDWLSQFVKLAFTAPIFLFFMYLILMFLKMPFTTSEAGYFETAAFIMIKLSIVGGLFMIAKKVTKDLAGKVGEISTKIAVGVAVTTATVATAAATGGASAVYAMGRRYAMNKATEGATWAGEKALGKEKMGALTDRFKSTTALRNFNPRAWGDLAGIVSGGKSKDNPMSQIYRGFREGKVINRKADMVKAKEAADKAKKQKAVDDAAKTKKIDKDIADLKKDKEAGLVTGKEYEEKLKDLAQQKKNITNPAGPQVAANAKAVADLDKAKQQKKDDKIDQKVSEAGSKVGRFNQALLNSVNSITDASQKIATVETERLSNETELNKTLQDISDNKDLYDNRKTGFTTRRNQAETRQQSARNELAQVEQELRAMPTTGPGVNQAEIIRLTSRRDQLVGEEKIASEQIAQVDNELAAATKSYTTTDSLLKKQRDELSQKKELLEGFKNSLEKQKNINDKIANLTNDVATTKAVLGVRKEEVGLQKELEMRTRIEKTDTTENRQFHEDRLRAINDRLTVIAQGRAPFVQPAPQMGPQPNPNPPTTP